MSTLREAILHARSGKTAQCGAKKIRLLTQEETNAYLLKHAPSRRIVYDEQGQSIAVEEYGDGRPEQLGLYDVGGAEPVQFQPTDEDIATEWELIVAEVVSGDELAEVLAGELAEPPATLQDG